MMSTKELVMTAIVYGVIILGLVAMVMAMLEAMG